MADPSGFLKIKREVSEYRPVCERIKDYKEISVIRPYAKSIEQASRCMDCGTPFCHWGCPIANIIPELNDFIYRGSWEKAVNLLCQTNNLPEITARVCPAICEYACVLGINDEPVTIRENELAVIEYAFSRGIIKPNPPKNRTGRKIAIIGSGPAGLACADQLNKAGHTVTVFEKNDKPGGILRYGIPDFKLEKWIIDRRLKILEKEGIIFKTNHEADYENLLDGKFDAVCLAIGSGEPRNLEVHGRELGGIWFAMDYLTQSNRRVSGEKFPAEDLIDAEGKHVVVIGGGDTGSDCIGTAKRQGALSITQLEILPKPPESRTDEMPWPAYPRILKISSSHEEGCIRRWSVKTKEFKGENGRVKEVICETDGKEFSLKADLVILAMGFINSNKYGNIKIDGNYMTSINRLFSAGDCHRGPSLAVWAIMEGREAARGINIFFA